MNDSTTNKHTSGRRKPASGKAILVYRLPLERKRKIHAKLAATGQTIQGFLEIGVELALAQLQTEKN